MAVSRKETLRIFSYLGVPLLQVVPLVGVVRVEPGRLLLLPLHESLKLELLLPLEFKRLRLLVLLQLLLLTQVNSLRRGLVTELMREAYLRCGKICGFLVGWEARCVLPPPLS